MSEIDEEFASILPMISKVLGQPTRRKSGPASVPGSMLLSDVPCFAVHQNPAVQRCCNLRNSLILESATPEQRLQWDKEFLTLYETFEQALGEDPEGYEITRAAALAYRAAMPDPTNRRTIKSYIACVLHAMSIVVLEPDEGTKLLNGARVASHALIRRPKNKNRINAPSEAADSPAESTVSAS